LESAGKARIDGAYQCGIASTWRGNIDLIKITGIT